MKTMRRLCCLFLLVPVVCIRVHAVHEIDGVVGRTEYKEPMIQLISTRYESNNDVSLAYLFWDISPEDYSIYVAVKYVCDDVGVLLDKLDSETDVETTAPEPDAAAAIELSVNGRVCITAYMDGSFPDMDVDKFDAESRFSFVRSATRDPDTNNFITEIRLGLKYWMPYDSTLGIRIYDCKGRPSNLYTVAINPAPTQTTSQTTSKAETKNKTETSSATHAASTTTGARTTRRVITAAKAAVHTSAVSESASKAKPDDKHPTKAPKTTKPKTTKAKSSSSKSGATGPKAAKALTTQALSSEMPLSVTEPSATVTSEEQLAVITPAVTAAGAIRLNRLRTAGFVCGAVLLTAAVMISVFIGLRAKSAKPEPQQPAEPTEPPPASEEPEEDDF